MALLILLITVGSAWLLRMTWIESNGQWGDRWYSALRQFLLPPLLLLTTAISIPLQMLSYSVIWSWDKKLSCAVCVVFLGWALLLWLHLMQRGKRMLQQVNLYPEMNLYTATARIVNFSMPYSAQIGFWRPLLVVSTGLFTVLEPCHLEAVLAHEQAHSHYRDTFWFFWLGWVRRTTSWLPETEAIWQELLLLRELRADQYAALQTNPLLLAEALVLVAQNTPLLPEDGYIAFNQASSQGRLVQRIEALLSEPTSINLSSWKLWGALLPMLIPFLAIVCHFYAAF
ncbi:M56 family metallopeptidase [Pantanalinema rosaneae CENA516]|uniref:M56 family metallopeptidase n=1 Tax=Pantanalinema rosaneae TaxID=1620701 RepID=UPI003D6E721A